LLNRFGDDALVGPHSMMGFLNSHGYPVFPSDMMEKEHQHFNGGFTVATYSKTHDIPAVQLEIGFHMRKDDQSRINFANALKDAILEHMTHYSTI